MRLSTSTQGREWRCPIPISSWIFDLDGTLLDTLASLANSFNRTLTSFGYPTHPVESYRYFIGDGLRCAVERCLPGDVDESAIDNFTRAQQMDYLKTWCDDVRPYEGIDEALQELKEQGMRLAVLSNKNHEFTLRCIKHFFAAGTFDVVQGHVDALPLKPDPAGALSIAGQLECDPAKVALIGDTSADIKTAIAAGMLPVGALWGFRTETELKNAGAAHIIEHPQAILEVTSR